MTNPNDILDAYDELVRLVDILGPDHLHALVDRACARRAAVQGDPKVIGKIIDIASNSDGLTVDFTLNTDAYPIRLADHVRKIAQEKPSPKQTGCPWCGLDIGKNTMFRHLNNTHRADLEQLYVEDGIKGLQDTFGVPYGTAWNWARKLDGEAA